MASKYTHDQAKQKRKIFPWTLIKTNTNYCQKPWNMKNYISYSYDWCTIYIILLYRGRDTYKNISSLSANSFHTVLPSSSCPNENITHFGSFLHEDDLLPRESEPIEPLCTIRLHIIVYYEIIIYRLVEGNIIATLSSRGREKSQFFFSITFRNYHVVLWGSDRFFMILHTIIMFVLVRVYSILPHTFWLILADIQSKTITYKIFSLTEISAD